MKSKLITRLTLVFLVAEVALILLSWLLSATMTEGVHSLLTPEGTRWLVGHFSDIVASPLLVWLLLLSMAWGAVLPLVQRPSPVGQHREAFLIACAFLILYIVVVLLLTVVPHAVLLSATGSLFPSPFSRNIIPIGCLGVFIFTTTFGITSGLLKSFDDVCRSLTSGIAQCAPLFLLYIFLIQFCESLRFVFF